MSEANPLKFYIAKFFFLAFALIQWAVAALMLIRLPITTETVLYTLVFLILGFVMFYIFLVVNDKVKRVAVGKNKIVIIEGDRNARFGWPDVKSLRIVPFFNMYRLKLRGKREPVYFFPAKNIDPAFGLLARDTSRMGSIVSRRKKQFKIK